MNWKCNNLLIIRYSCIIRYQNKGVYFRKPHAFMTPPYDARWDKWFIWIHWRKRVKKSSGFHAIQRLDQAWLAAFWKDSVVKKSELCYVFWLNYKQTPFFSIQNKRLIIKPNYLTEQDLHQPPMRDNSKTWQLATDQQSAQEPTALRCTSTLKMKSRSRQRKWDDFLRGFQILGKQLFG